MHGAVLPYAFSVVAASGTHVTLRFDARTVVGVGFPWRFTTTLTYALTGDGLAVTTTVANVDVEDFPAGFGYHPYLVRELVPGRGEALLEAGVPGSGIHVLAPGEEVTGRFALRVP